MKARVDEFFERAVRRMIRLDKYNLIGFFLTGAEQER